MSSISAIDREGIIIALAFMIPPALVVYVVLAALGRLPTLGFIGNIIIVVVGSFTTAALAEYAGDE